MVRHFDFVLKMNLAFILFKLVDIGMVMFFNWIDKDVLIEFVDYLNKLNNLNDWVIMIFFVFCILWYVYDWIRGYAIMDLQSIRLRRYFQKNITGNSVIFETKLESKVNDQLKKIKIRRKWKKPNDVVVVIKLPNNQEVANGVNDRLEKGEYSVVDWLQKQTGVYAIGLRNRHWHVNRDKMKKIIIVGERDW